MDRLMPLVQEVKPFDLRSTTQIVESIKQSALKKQENAPKIKVYNNVTYEAEELEPYQEKEIYLDQEWGVVGKGGRKILGLFGRRKNIWGWKPVTKERMVTKYRPIKVTKTEIKESLVTPDLKPFEQEALREHLA